MVGDERKVCRSKLRARGHHALRVLIAPRAAFDADIGVHLGPVDRTVLQDRSFVLGLEDRQGIETRCRSPRLVSGGQIETNMREGTGLDNAGPRCSDKGWNRKNGRPTVTLLVLSGVVPSGCLPVARGVFFV